MKAALYIVLGMIVSNTALAGVIFQDDFNDGDTAGWSFVGQNAGLWNVGTSASGEKKIQSASTQTPYVGSSGFALIDGVTTSNHFKLEADVQVVGPVPNKGGSLDYGHVGFVWGYQDLSNFNTSYLRTHWDHVTNWSRSPFSGEYHLQPFSASNATDLDGLSYRMSIEVDYLLQEMTVMMDAASVVFTGAAFDAINANTGGGIGLVTWGERVSYDNVVLHDYSQNVPAPATIALIGLGLIGVGATRRRKR